MTKSNDVLDPNDIVRGKITIKTNAWEPEGSTPKFDTQEYSDFNPENRIDHGFWINDLYFEVPPEKISVQEENNFMESQAMRSRGSSKIPVGIANEIYTIQFNIVEKDSIKNIDDRGFMTGWNTGKRGGVLDLILQFKNVPFVCVENAFLRSRLKIPDTHNMVFCAHNLALSTSPGEPGVLVGTLSLSPMAYTPFSDRWLFKKTWVSITGKSTFEDVNFHALVKLKERMWYQWGENKSYQQKKMEQEQIAYSANTFYIASKVFAPDASGTGNRQNVINPRLANSHERPLSKNEADLIAPFAVTRYASESEVYKTYIDWLHSQSTSVIVNNSYENNTYDFTKISPYGSKTHDLGRELKFTWREFKNISIDPQVSDAIRLYIKRKLTLFRWELFKGSQTASTFYSGETTEGYTLNGEWKNLEKENNEEAIPYIIAEEPEPPPPVVPAPSAGSGATDGSGAGSGSGDGSGTGSGSGEGSAVSTPQTTGGTDNSTPDGDGSANVPDGSAQNGAASGSGKGKISNGSSDSDEVVEEGSAGFGGSGEWVKRNSGAAKTEAIKQPLVIQLTPEEIDRAEFLKLGIRGLGPGLSDTSAEDIRSELQNLLLKRTEEEKKKEAERLEAQKKRKFRIR